MNEWTSAVIIALITSVFSVITLIIQKRLDKVINKIDEQSTFIEKEKKLKQKLSKKDKEIQFLAHDMMLLIMNTNMAILKNTRTTNNAHYIDDGIFEDAENLKEKFIELKKEKEELDKEYAIVLDMTEQFQEEIQRLENNK